MTRPVRKCRYPGAADSCFGGQRVSANEQSTQQSPLLGRSNVPQFSHSYKCWQAFTGMVSVLAWPHSGQVMVD